MLLQPKRRKFRKERKGRITNKLSFHKANNLKQATRFSLKYGEYGLIAGASARFSARQLEASRRTATAHIKRIGRLWIRAFPDIPVTAKPLDARMGKGKGAVSYWISRVEPGQVLYEVSGINETLAISTLRTASKKLPFPTRFVRRITPSKILGRVLLNLYRLLKLMSHSF